MYKEGYDRSILKVYTLIKGVSKRKPVLERSPFLFFLLAALVLLFLLSGNKEEGFCKAHHFHR